MNKNFKLYIAIWAVLFVLYNAVAFLIRPIASLDGALYNGAFWDAWGITLLTFGCNLVCAYITLRQENLTKMFYRISLIRISYTCLMLMFVASMVLMLIPGCPVAVSAIVCVLVLAFHVISMIKAEWASEALDVTERKTRVNTMYIRNLTVDAENLVSRAKTPEAKDACKKVYEALRYSDPVSSDALMGIESEIDQKFADFSVTIKSGDDASALADELLELIADRNRKNKVLK